MSPRPLHHSVLLWRLRRHPLLWWALALLAVGASGLALQGSLGAAAGCSGSERPASAPAASGALATTVAADERAVAVPVAGGLALAVGDEVDVVAPGEASVEGALGGEPRTVAEAVVVVQVAPEAVTVAVPEREAADVALAASQGGTTLLLRGEG